MEGHLTMSASERERLKVYERVKRGELSLKEAAALDGLSYRQTRRLYKRYCKSGDRGLVHQGRGRPSNRAHPAGFKATVLTRYQERYPDFGPTLAAEKLALDGHVVDHETLRGWFSQSGTVAEATQAQQASQLAGAPRALRRVSATGRFASPMV